MSLLDYEGRFSSLRVNSQGGEKSPHKVAMLSAIIALIERDELRENKIEFVDSLRKEFSRQFAEVAGPRDRDNPHLPFFHLRSSGFWHHRLRPGKAGEYAEMSTASGPRVIESIIAYAFLDDELFELLSNEFARNLLRTALRQSLTIDGRREILGGAEGWDWLECEAIVQDYFSMLAQELAGTPYSKAAHRRRLMPLLNDRSEGSIEYKHQNISAILLEFRQTYITGYKPASNYQQQLKQVVLAHLAANKRELEQICASADDPAVDYSRHIDWNQIFDPDLPELVSAVAEQSRSYLASTRSFAERERRNRSLGERGEAFVLEFERARLKSLGRADLSREVEWSSKDRGDGLGYDVLSFDVVREEELFIEVKTTSRGKHQPFYISDNELAFSKDNSRQYRLYRVYDFHSNARLFELPGAVDQHVHLRAQQYKASFN